MRVLLLASPELPDVEFEFLALEDVAVGATRLTRSAGDGSVQTTSSELGFERWVDFCVC